MRRRRLASVVSVGLAVVAAACVKFGEDPTKAKETKAPLVCAPPERPPGDARVVPAFPSLTFEEPTRLVRREDGSARWYVLERKGVLRTFEDRDDVAGSSVFADLAAAGLVYDGDVNDGLLGLVFSPRFAEDGELFIGYTAPTTLPDATFEYRIDRGRSNDGGLTLDLSSLERVLVIPRQQSTHHGAQLLFGPDGMLYASTGDGRYGDPGRDAQRMSSLLGKVLRIDVRTKPYVVPDDNPFLSDPEARPEIWAVGFRNPWVMSFDRETGDLWAGDVGHVRWEEIDLVTKGGNYGWSVREGPECFNAERCREEGFVPPVYAYPHSEGFSVTLGFVYRGAALPAHRGALVFGDYLTGRVSALREGAAKTVVESGRLIAAFAEARDGEILFVDWATGTLQRIVREDRPSVIPEALSATGCFDPSDGRVAPSLVPYEVNMPLWSDGADKERWVALPEDGFVTITRAGDWRLPVGSAVFKTFVLGGRKIETRMLVNHREGAWAGYSYAWNDEGTDAVLLEGSEVREIGGGRTWTFPSRSDCFTCHNLAAGRTLGFSTGQMDRDGQVEAFLGEDAPVARMGGVATLSDGRDTDSIEHRARSYMAVNCGNCHRPSGPASGLGDFRMRASFADMRACNVPVQSGPLGAVRLRPGDPDGSEIVRRMRTQDGTRMPPLASAVVDEIGAGWVSAWIASLPADACPLAGPVLSP